MWIGSLAALGAYAARHAGLGRLDSHLALNEPQADALIRHFGKRLRAARGTHTRRGGPQPPMHPTRHARSGSTAAGRAPRPSAMSSRRPVNDRRDRRGLRRGTGVQVLPAPCREGLPEHKEADD